LFGEAQKLLTSIVISLRPRPAIAISFGSWSRDADGRAVFIRKPKRRLVKVPTAKVALKPSPYHLAGRK
jgi:hypothetical protein